MIMSNLWYINNVNNRISHYLVPKIITDLELPKSRSIHINMLNTIDEENYESLAILNKIPKSILYVYNDTTLFNPIGKITKKYVNAVAYGSELKRQFKKTQIVKEGDNKKLGVNDLIVFNYKLIHNANKYQVNKLNNYYILYNSLNEMINILNSPDKGGFEHNVVVMDIPTIIPKRSDLKLFNKPVTQSTINKFTTIDELLILELYKMFFVDSDSVFKNIKPEVFNTTFFLFRSGGRYTIYKLKDMLSLSKDLKIEDGRFTGFGERVAAESFIVGLLMFKKSLTEELGIGLVDIDDNSVVGNLDELYGDLEDDTEIDEVEESVESEDTDDVVIKNEDTDDVVIKNEDTNVIVPKKSTTTEFKVLDLPDAEVITNLIQSRTRDKKLSAKESTKLTEVIETQGSSVFVINGKNTTLDEILDYDNTNIVMGNTVTANSDSVIDKELLGNNNRTFDREYLEKLYKKDVFNAIYSIQKSGAVITKHEVKTTATFLGNAEEHIIEIKPVDGAPSTVRFKIPEIASDSTYKMSSNKYIMRHQRMDLPIRKTNSTTVLLSSYAGKLFIVKNLYKRHNPSEWLFKQMVGNDEFTNIINTHSAPYDLALPKEYTLFSNKFLRFNHHDDELVFDYKNRFAGIDAGIQLKLKQYEKDNNVIYIGINKKEKAYKYMKISDIVSSTMDFKTIETIKTVEEFFNLSFATMPIEYASLKVYNKIIPLGLVMLYYLGIDKLLEKLKTTVKFEDLKYKPTKTEYIIPIADGKLVFDRYHKESSIVMGGIDKNVLTQLKFSDLNNKALIASFFNFMELPISYSNELDNIESLHIDNITRESLRLMNEPTNIHDLLIRASNMLMDDNYRNPNNILENSIKQYERIPGLIYNKLNRSVREFTNKNVFSKAKITMDPYSIWKAIGDDSTSMLVDDTNPLAKIKQDDNVTYMGEFGRSKITMTIPTRIMTPDEIGIISEATPDSGDSGINTYLTHNAEILNLRGMIKPIDTNETTLNKAMSTVNVLLPATTRDDSKRSNFASTQSSHITSMTQMKPVRYRTGAEGVIAAKAGEPFTKMSEGYGIVTKKTSNSITIEYYKPIENILLITEMKDLEMTSKLFDGINNKYYNVLTGETPNTDYKRRVIISKSRKEGYVTLSTLKDVESFLATLTKGRVSSYIKTYPIKSWSSKVEGGSAIKHIMISNLNVDDNVEPGMAIIYDSGFFTPDIYDNKRLVFMSGSFYKVAFMEKKANYEDSLIVNEPVLESTGTLKYKVISIVVDIYNSITNIKDEGDKVSYGDKMMSILDSSMSDDASLSDRAKEILKDVSDNSPKADVNGIIDRIDVLYNCELDNMDKTIRNLVDRSNKRFQSEQGTNGHVTSEYSINGNPLLPNQIELKYYISHHAKTKIGDKFIISAQLKNTIGKILSDITTMEGEKIDFIFSNKSTFARIVNSAYVVGTTNLLLEKITKNAINIYRSK